MDKSTKRQRFVTQKYSPPSKETLWNRRKKYIYSDSDSDSDLDDMKAPVVRNLKISGWFFFIIILYILYFILVIYIICYLYMNFKY